MLKVIRKNLILLVSMLILGVITSQNVSAEVNNFWRAEQPKIQGSGYLSLVISTKNMQKAIKSSDGSYLFSEKGAGVKDLVLVGTYADIFDYLSQNSTTVIKNQIKDLPNIYVGISKYQPQEQYKVVSPLMDGLSQAIMKSLGFSPFGEVISDISAVPGDLKEMHDAVKAFKKAEPNSKYNKEIIYFKIGYMPEQGMIKVGKGSVTIRDVINVFGK